MRMRLPMLLLMCFYLCACTNATRLAYNNLDWLLYRKVDRFVDLDSIQRANTKLALDNFHIWHRQTQLPIYEDFLDSFSKQISTTQLNGDDIHQRIDEIQVFIDASLEQLIPPATKVIQTLSDKQVEEVLENVAEEREEYANDYVNVSEEKRIDKHCDNLIDTVKPWLGRLNSEQKELVNEWAKKLEPYEELYLKQQLIWAQDLSRILANRQDQAALQAGLESLMFYRTDDWDPKLEAILDRNQAMTYDFLARLINEATPKQRKHLLDKFSDFRGDFLVLSEQE